MAYWLSLVLMSMKIHRIEVSHRQERHYGVRALREEFDFAQDNNEANNSPRYRITQNDTTNVEWNGKDMAL